MEGIELSEWVAIPGAVSWLVCYLLIIRRGFKDRRPAMPAAALVANLAWEAMFGLIYPDQFPIDLVNKTWFIFDLIILWQYLRFGSHEFDAWLPRWLFLPAFVFSQAVAFGLVIGFHLEFDDSDGRYTGWFINILMSGTYVAMLLRRPGVEGQSLWIGLTRMTGTAILDVAQMMMTPSWPLGGEGGLGPLMTVMYAATFVLDGTYLWLFIRRAREVGVNPWTRF